MMKKNVLPAFSSLIILCAGCAIQPTLITPPPVETRAIVEPAPKLGSEILLNYLLEARAMSAADLAAEKDRARTEFSQSKTEMNRLKLAILIALSPGATAGAPAGAPASAVASATIAEESELNLLLEPLIYATAYGATAPNPAPAADLRALATLIQALVVDRKKLRDQLKDSIARTQTTRREEASSQTEARILRAKVEELEKKLDALKSIERSVSVKSEKGEKK